MKKIAVRILACICCFIALVSSMGVSANWMYAELFAEGKETNVGVGLKEFTWAPEEVLPDSDVEMESHLVLVEDIVNGDGIGLNDSNSYLNQQIERRKEGTYIFILGWVVPQRDTLGSMAVRQDETLSEQFNLEERSMSFLMYFPEYNDSEYYLFTWDKDKQVAVGGIVTPVYRTLIRKSNGVWTEESAARGYATAAYYEESRTDADYSQLLSIEPDSWLPGTPD